MRTYSKFEMQYRHLDSWLPSRCSDGKIHKGSLHRITASYQGGAARTHSKRSALTMTAGCQGGTVRTNSNNHCKVHDMTWLPTWVLHEHDGTGRDPMLCVTPTTPNRHPTHQTHHNRTVHTRTPRACTLNAAGGVGPCQDEVNEAAKFGGAVRAKGVTMRGFD